MDYKDLYNKAQAAMVNAYAPYSKFKVGAALLAKDGTVFTGVNVENGSFGATICAERTACVKAVSEGYKEFDAIAVVSSRGAAPMCGICRQFLSEFSTDIDVITGDNEDHLEVKKLSSLLPENFSL
jgi:cytidine deaminase, homotetrameric